MYPRQSSSALSQIHSTVYSSAGHACVQNAGRLVKSQHPSLIYLAPSCVDAYANHRCETPLLETAPVVCVGRS
jgi:hypothetical protein